MWSQTAALAELQAAWGKPSKKSVIFPCFLVSGNVGEDISCLEICLKNVSKFFQVAQWYWTWLLWQLLVAMVGELGARSYCCVCIPNKNIRNFELWGVTGSRMIGAVLTLGDEMQRFSSLTGKKSWELMGLGGFGMLFFSQNLPWQFGIPCFAFSFQAGHTIAAAGNWASRRVMIWPEKKHLRRMGGLAACMKLATEDALYVRQTRGASFRTNREAFESEAATVQSAMVHLAKCMASVPLSRFHVRRQPLFPHPPAFRYTSIAASQRLHCWTPRIKRTACSAVPNPAWWRPKLSKASALAFTQ